MRAILALLVIVALIAIVLIMTDVININVSEEGQLPTIEAEAGSLPEIDVDTADIDIGTETRQVEVPSIDVQSADEVANQTENAQ